MSAPAHSSQELLESWGDVVPTYDSDLNDYPSSPYGYLGRYQRPATALFDRADGRFLPVYQTEFDLAVIRSMGRSLAVAAPGLVGGLRNMCNYTIGEGFSFTATRETNADLTEKQCEPLLKLIQTEIAKFLDDNNFLSGFDREIHDTSIIDGESFLYLQAPEDRVRVSRCEPDQVREPAGARELEDWIQGAYGIDCDSFVSSWTFGVHTRADALDDPLGYHVVADESGVNWEYVPADRMVHIKRNVTRNAKRGFSDFYPIEADSARAEKLRRNMAEGAAIQSAIAFVRQHVAGTTRAGVETMLGENKSATQYPTGFYGLGRPKSIVQYRPGTVVDLSAGLEYKPGPLGSERASDFLLVASYVQRMQAVRWSMPEYMFSGDASNANYASTMEATAPFVKSCEAEQRFYSRHFVALIWKALKLRWELGAFDRFDYEWERIEQSIKITADCPEVATRDELANVQRQEILIRLGILSRKTAAAQNGLDYDTEVANGAAVEGQGGQGGTGAPTSQSRQEPLDRPPELQSGELGEALLVECGGRNGKPGPCKRVWRSRKGRRGSRVLTKHARLKRLGTVRRERLAQRKQKRLTAQAARNVHRESTPPQKLTPVAADQPIRTEQSAKQSVEKHREGGSDHKPPAEKAAKVARRYKRSTRKRQRAAMIFQRNFMTRLGGRVVADNAPSDGKSRDINGNPHHKEYKATFDRATDTITVTPPALDRKARLVADTGIPLSTVVEDHRYHFERAKNHGANFSQHVLYYKRGAGSFHFDDMYPCKDVEEIRRLDAMADDELPELARPTHKWKELVKEAKSWTDRGSIKSVQAKRAQDEANREDFI